jgi:hypothetical protein
MGEVVVALDKMPWLKLSPYRKPMSPNEWIFLVWLILFVILIVITS